MDMTRRTFLKLAGFAAAACAAPPVFSALAPAPTTLRTLITHVEIYRTDGKAGPIFEVPDSWFVSPWELVNGEISYGPVDEVMTVGGLRFFGPTGDVIRLPFRSGAACVWHGCTVTAAIDRVSASLA